MNPASPKPGPAPADRRHCPIRGALNVLLREAEAEMRNEALDAEREALAAGRPPSREPYNGPARQRYLFRLNEFLAHTDKHGC